MFCSKCGNAVNGNFCPKCGNRVNENIQNNSNINNVSNNNYIPNNNSNISMNKNVVNGIELNKQQNDKYAILSVIMPIVGVISCFIISILFGAICIICGYEFAKKGKFSTKANMATVGKVLNIISTVIIIILWVLAILAEVNK